MTINRFFLKKKTRRKAGLFALSRSSIQVAFAASNLATPPQNGIAKAATKPLKPRQDKMISSFRFFS